MPDHDPVGADRGERSLEPVGLDQLAAARVAPVPQRTIERMDFRVNQRFDGRDGVQQFGAGVDWRRKRFEYRQVLVEVVGR